MKKFGTILLLAVVACFALAFTGCDSAPADGEYTEGGLVFEVKNHGATVVGAESGATEVTVPAEFKGLDVEGIANNAFQNSSIKKLTFAEGLDSFFSIGEFVFENSSVEEIVNFPANIDLIDYNAFAGMKNLKSISVSGTGKFSVENGALMQAEKGEKYLRLLPAASEPQTNFEDGTYTVTGVDRVFNHAVSYNRFITDVVIGKDVGRVQADAFSHIKLNSVSFGMGEPADTMVESGAFSLHKDLKIFVPAKNDSEVDSWLNYSKNLIYNHSLLVHPASCERTDVHCHGIRTSMADGSFAGYDCRLHEESQTIDVILSSGPSGATVGCWDARDLFTEYEG